MKNLKILFFILFFIMLSCETEKNGNNPEPEDKRCKDVVCDHGKCKIEDDMAICKCDPGYIGLKCEENRDDCRFNLCKNATCIDEINSYKCECNAGFAGKYCDQNIDNCPEVNPCQNGGVCIDGDDSFSCECKIGFKGERCEEIFKPFITTWKTDNLGESDYNQITISTDKDYTYKYNIDCDNDGAFEAVDQTGDFTCEYYEAGVATVVITGVFPKTYFSFGSDRQKILSVEQWGTNRWKSMKNAFWGCINLEINATDTPDLSEVTDMSDMFRGAYGFNSDISSWDVSNVKNMKHLFRKAESFNQDLSSWNVENVEDMEAMFYGMNEFNQDLSSWKVSRVTNCKDFSKETASWILAKPNFTNCNP